MGCFELLKLMMFLFNGIIFVVGASVLGVGIWVKTDSGSVFSFIGKIEGAPPQLGQVLNMGYLLIAIGLVLLVIGFLGCYGAAKENGCMLLLFFVIITLLFIIQLLGAVVILMFRPLANELLSNFGTAAVLNIKKDFGKNRDATGLWKTTMNTLKCCGFYNSSDFINSPYYVDTKNHYPPQCCPGMVKPCDKLAAENVAKVVGCFSKIKKLIDENTNMVATVALAVSGLELFAMAVSMILFCIINNSRD